MSTASDVIKLCEPTDLFHFVADQTVAPIRKALEVAGPGQRLRITSLPDTAMSELCERLQGDSRWVARLLIGSDPQTDWQATATKIIELRNNLVEPLLVLIPPGLRTAAEDSLDIATFTELSLADLGRDSENVLAGSLPDDLRRKVLDCFAFLRVKGVVRNSDQVTEYLLTLLKNGPTPQSAGAALCVFGLVPDFRVFARTNPNTWLSRNLQACQELSDVSRPLFERIVRIKLAPNTMQKDLFSFLRQRRSDDTFSWSTEIAVNEDLHHLSFDKWPYPEAAEEQELRIVVEPLQLPVQKQDQVAGATQMLVLDLEGRQGLKVSFHSIPHHGEVNAWRTFRVQIVSCEDNEGTIAWESNNLAKAAGRNRRITRTFKVADLQNLEEGTYFARVDAYDESGAVITQPRPLDPDDDDSRKENESELFLVIRGDTEIDAPEPRAVYVRSLHDGWTAAATKNLKSADPLPDRTKLTGTWLEPIGAALRGDVHFRIEGDQVAGYTVVVPGLLRRIELDILQHPDQWGMVRVNLADARSLADVEVTRRTLPSLPQLSEINDFLTIRATLLQAILSQHITRSGSEGEAAIRTGVVETSDLTSLAEQIRLYANSFLKLIRPGLQSREDNAAVGRMWRVFAQLDAVELRWRKATDDPGRAMMLAPTHPVRLLWQLQHAHVLEQAVVDHHDQLRKAPRWKEFFAELRGELAAVNLPMVLFDTRGRGYVERGPLTSHWSLYLPDRGDDEKPIDAAASGDRVRELLGVRGRSTQPTLVGAHDLAGRIFEFIQQHPYVEQLKLNVFNPGDGRLIADTLREVETRRRKSMNGRVPFSLRYAVQMFGRSEHLHSMGDTLESLLDPDRQVGEDDEFTLMSDNHLLPKLVFARNTVDDFLLSPADFTAHVSVFIEQFSTTTRLGKSAELRRGSYVCGLIQEPDLVLETSGNEFAWYKGLNPIASSSPGRTEELICQTAQATNQIQSVAATGRLTTPDTLPVVALQLDSRTQGLLKQVHAQSDWVITVDRNMGIDYFDSATSSGDCGYLLDFAPEYLQEDRQRLFVTTRSTVELESLVHPALDSFGLTLESGNEVVVLEALRSLSGRLALRLLSSPTHRAEVVGLLLARWLLERAGLLGDRIIIPVDSHRSWFQSDEEAMSKRRADLLVAAFDVPSRTVHITVVEVKLRKDLSDSARGYVYADMKEQADNTRKRIRDRFDPDLYPEKRADFLLRAKELSTLLSFYIRRGMRYGLLEKSQAEAALTFVQDLDAGYRLELQTTGVLFEQLSPGSHKDEDEPGFPVHRFGEDIGRRLLHEATEAFYARHDSSTRKGPPAVDSDAAEPIRTDSQFDSFKTSLGGTTSLGPSVPPPSPPSAAEKKPQPIGTGPVQPTNSEGVQEGAAPPTPPETDDADVGEAAPGTQDSDVDEEVAALTQDAPRDSVTADILLGASQLTSQYGLIGRFSDAKVAIDLTGCNTISLFGVQGFGKSYTLGVIAEMAVKEVSGVNCLPSPLANVIFHYHKSDSYAPEFATAVSPNQNQREIDRLLSEYGAHPCGLTDVVLLTPEAKVEDRRREYPNLEIEPIKFNSAELGAESWKFLLGAYGNDSFYIRQMVAIMRRHRGDLTLDTFEQEIQNADLPRASQRLAEDRINLARPYVDDSTSLGAVLRPGRTVIVDLRDEWIEKDEALGLFVVMLRIFAKSRHNGKEFNKLVVFDEAHKYITESDLIGQVVETIREMRHQATSVVIASQDPISVPRAVIELTSLLILHRITSPQWLRHLKSALSALDSTKEGHLTSLQPGDALVWAQRTSDARFNQRPQRIQIRPRFSQHGGRTKTAVEGDTIR